MFQSQDEFSGEDLRGKGGTRQACHNGGGDPEVEGDRGYANEEAGFKIHRWESMK